MNMDEYPEEADEHSPREALSDDENDQPKKRKKHGKKKRHSHTTEVEDEIEIFPDVPHDGNIIPYLHDEEEENKKEADAVGVVETVAARELASRESCESVELPTTVAAERVLTSSYDDSHQKPAGSGGRKHHKSSVNNSIREDAVLMADYGNQYHDVDRPPQQDASLMASYGDKYASNDNNEKSSPKTKKKKRKSVDVNDNHPPAATRLEADSFLRLLRSQRYFEQFSPNLYNYNANHVLEWPSLSVEWISNRRFADPERDYTLQSVAVGSQARRGEQNYVKIMEVAVSNCAWGGGGVNYQLYGEDDDENAEGELEVEIEEGKQFKHVRGHFQCDQTIPVDSPVLRICALPFENNIIAVKTATGVVTVYNTLQQDEEGGESSPEAITDAVLDGSRVGGFGLAWSPVKIGFLASAGDDGLLQYWDVRHQLSVDLKEHTDRAEDAHGPLVAAAHTFTGHRDSITSCDWHHSQGHLLATSGLDGDLRLWDIRTSKCAGTVPSAHEGGALCCQFHPSSAHQLTSSGADGSLHLYDIRKTMAPPLLTLDYHGKAVYRFSWSPFAESVLCSAGDDGRVVLWDISKSTVSASYTSRVAPPEVSFLHLGHLGKVTDVAWCTSVEEPWLLASTDSSNGLQLYRPREEVVKDHLSVFEW